MGEETPKGFGPAVEDEVPAGFGPAEGTTPSGQPMGHMPELPPPDALTMAEGYPRFLGQTAKAAGKNLSDTYQSIKSDVSAGWNQLKEDPSAIVPMWFGGMMKGLGAGAKAVTTPISAVAHGDVSDAISLAAGGNPDAARQYRDQGNAGGEFWEMMGKPLTLMAAGEMAGMVGNTIPEGAAAARLRVVRGLMRDTSAVPATDLTEAQLAQQALQDAAREMYGTGKSGVKGLKGALPSRDRGVLGILSGNPLTASRVEAGNAELVRLTQRAVELAGSPADQVNSIFGYMDGRQAKAAIQADLLAQARTAAQNGLTGYANQLRQRAAALDHAGTLGEIYEVKKAANKLSGVVKNTQDSIELMDSWSALAGAIRKEVYPLYERQVQSTMPQLRFSVSQAGQKEGAAIALRNGVEARLATAQTYSDAVHLAGHPEQMAAHGSRSERIGMSYVTRKLQQAGIIPTEQGSLNIDARNAVGRLSPDTVPEHLQVTRQPQFNPAPPQTTKLLPGSTVRFQIPGNLPELGTEGQIAHPAEKVQGRHAVEPPQFTTSSSSREVSPTVYGKKNPRTGEQPIITPSRNINEGQMGADIRSAVPPEAQSDVAHGAGTIETTDVRLAQNALDRMLLLQQRYRRIGATVQQQTQLSNAIQTLAAQLNAYHAGQGKARMVHVPPVMTYTPRVTGNIPVTHPLRASMPAASSSVEREREKKKNATQH